MNENSKNSLILAVALAILVFSSCGTNVLEDNLKKSDIRICQLLGNFTEAKEASNNYYFSCLMSVSVESYNDISGDITNFQFQVKDGDETLLLVNNSNYQSYFATNVVYMRVNAYKRGLVELISDICLTRECSHKYFRGRTPKTVSVIIGIKDDNGYSYTLENSSPFQRFFL